MDADFGEYSSMAVNEHPEKGTKRLEIIRYKAQRDESRWCVDGVPWNAQLVSAELEQGQMWVTVLIEDRSE